VKVHVGGFVVAVVLLLPGCGDGDPERYKSSLASKRVYSVLQIEEERLRGQRGKAFVYKAADDQSDLATVALPARDGSGYVVFTAQGSEGRVLSVPEDRSINVNLGTLRDLLRKGLISDAAAAELVRRSA
jgi:hypothetical protein